MLREERIDRAVLEADLEQVQKSLQVCRRIFGGMLAFARGGVRRARNGHVRTAVETSLAILRSGIERRGVQLSIEVPDDQALPPVACAQSDLEQVLLNLLANARDATDQGGTVSIRARPSPEGVTLVIEDTGQGIAPEHLPRVFEPFFSTKASGNGLGLTICRSIVWEAGGTLDIDSTVGLGHARARHDSGRRLSQPCRPHDARPHSRGGRRAGDAARDRARAGSRPRRHRQRLLARGARARGGRRRQTWPSSTSGCRSWTASS